jgi:hypothetical protein
MVAEAISYDTSLFQNILSYPAYKTKNVVVLNGCIKDLEQEQPNWKKIGSEGAGEKESPLSRISTNFLAMTIVLNRLNNLLLFLRRKGTDYVEGENGLVSTEQLNFMTNHPNNKVGFEMEYERFHELLKHFKELILAPGSKTYEEIINILSHSTPIQKEQNIFLKNIHQFFPKAIDVKAEETFGSVQGGLDVEFNFRGNLFKAKVVPSQRIERDGEYYKIWSDFHPDMQKVDFIVFTLPNNYVYVFENDKTKFRDLAGDTLHNRTSQAGLSFLLHTDTLMNYKKLF